MLTELQGKGRDDWCSLTFTPASLPPSPGYLLALGPLLFISICDVWLQLFSRDQAYAINLAAVGTVAFGCTGRARGGWAVSHVTYVYIHCTDIQCKPTYTYATVCLNIRTCATVSAGIRNITYSHTFRLMHSYPFPFPCITPA